MDDVLPLDLALELAAELDQTRKLAGLDALFDGRVERAAERDVHRTLLGSTPSPERTGTFRNARR